MPLYKGINYEYYQPVFTRHTVRAIDKETGETQIYSIWIAGDYPTDFAELLNFFNTEYGELYSYEAADE